MIKNTGKEGLTKMSKILDLAYEHGLFSDGTPDSWDQEHLKKFGEALILKCIQISHEFDLPKMSGPGTYIASSISAYFDVDY